MLSRDSEAEMWSRFVFELVIWPQEITFARWTQPSGPLCLWQCFILLLVFPVWPLIISIRPFPWRTPFLLEHKSACYWFSNKTPFYWKRRSPELNLRKSPILFLPREFSAWSVAMHWKKLQVHSFLEKVTKQYLVAAPLYRYLTKYWFEKKSLLFALSTNSKQTTWE